MRHATDAEVQAAVEAAIQEKGADYVYVKPNDVFTDPDKGDCLYVHNDQPGCIVGNVMHRLGVPLETLRRHEGSNAWTLIDSLALEGVLDISEWSRAMLDSTQCSQDRSKRWAEAVAYGRSDAEGNGWTRYE